MKYLRKALGTLVSLVLAATSVQCYCGSYQAEVQRRTKWCDAIHDASLRKLLLNTLSALPSGYTSPVLKNRRSILPLSSFENYELTGLNGLRDRMFIHSECVNGTQVARFYMVPREPLVLKFRRITTQDALEIVAADVRAIGTLRFSTDPFESTSVGERRTLDRRGDAVTFSVDLEQNPHVKIIDHADKRSRTGNGPLTRAWLLQSAARSMVQALEKELKPRLIHSFN
ncbi:hypothetical protein V5799_018647, partial [Amblyomma americanum]